MIPDRLLLAREGAGALHQGLGHLVVVDLDANLLADFGKEEAQADASLGDAPIIGARLVFCRVLVGKALAGLLLIGLNLLPDSLEFLLDKARRQFERVFPVERIQKRPLQLLARSATPLGFEIAADRRLHRL